MISWEKEVNTYKTEWVNAKIKNAALEFKNGNGGKELNAYMGLAFKPDIEDLREPPAI
jgi:UDP-N-acetyl-D-mannosaminuronic acid dehydrogenase